MENQAKSEVVHVQGPEPERAKAEPGLREIDVRLNNLEKLYDTVMHVSDGAVGSFNEYLRQKTESESRSHQLEDTQHKRSSWILGYAITILFALCLVAFVKEQYELVKLILTSGFAVAAGAGLTASLRNSKGKPQ